MIEQPRAAPAADPEPGTSSAAVRVRRVEAALRSALEPILAEHDLAMDHWRIIAVVDDEPGLGMSEIAAASVVPAASLTRHMDRLVERGIVVRRVDPVDRRRSVLALAPHGRAYAERLRAAEREALVVLGVVDDALDSARIP